MREKLVDFLEKNIEGLDINKFLEVPKLERQGDFALPLFLLSKELKKAPNLIAKEYEEKISSSLPDFLEKVEAAGPYLNFFINSEMITKDILDSVFDDSIFEIKDNISEKILIEYPSPNTNKALHVGHTRNILLGNSLKQLLNKVGHDVIVANLNNDRGIAICKTMLGYQLYGEGNSPETENMKSDHFVAKYYVLFEKMAKENPDLKLEEKAQQMLVDWENGKEEVIALWKKLLEWVYEGYTKTYQEYKYCYDIEFFESKIYDKGKDIVLDALKKGIEGFKVDTENGAIYVDLEDKKLGTKYLIRGDGTTLYMTQDIYLAKLKYEKYDADRNIFIVGSEQKYHFDVLFEILRRLGFGGTDKNHHFAFGMVYDKDGKKFSSRKGNAFGADEFVDLVYDKSMENLKEKSPELDSAEMEKRAKIIGYGALAFSILKVNPLSDINFDANKSLSFEGETGPYVQYTYARIKSVLRKADFSKNTEMDYSLLSQKEVSLIKLFGEYQDIVLEASRKFRPSMVANYLLKISQSFNEFYQSTPILKEEEKISIARLNLCYATSKILKDGLSLLGIDTLEEM